MSIKSFIFSIVLKLNKRNMDKHENKQSKIPDINTQRKFIQKADKFIGKLQHENKNAKLVEDTLNNLYCYHVFPSEKTKAVVLYLHGGAYVFGLRDSASCYRYISTQLAQNAQAEVYSIEYRLAPEHPYPAALEDAYSAYLALLEKGIRPFLAGDSAGGGLALALAMKLRDDNKPLPQGMLLMSPWTDLALTGESLIKRKDLDPILITSLLQSTVDSVLNGQSAMDPYISPLYGKFEGLPPMMLFLGGREILFDDTMRVFEKAKKAGVDVSLEFIESMVHCYPVFGDIFPEGRKAIKHMAEFIEKHASPRPSKILNF